MPTPARTTTSRWSGSTRPTSGRVDPTVPGFWRARRASAPAPTNLGATVYSYGNSSLRAASASCSPKQGGWSRTRATAGAATSTRSRPGIPGDSGSGFLDASGQAIGTLSTVTIAPTAGSNGIGDLSRELAYAQSHGFGGLALVPGTRPFSGDLAGAILGG